MMPGARDPLPGRAPARIGFWRRLVGLAAPDAGPRRTVGRRAWNGLQTLLAELAEGKGGESLARERVARLIGHYAALDMPERRRFFTLLEAEFEVEEARVMASIEAYRGAGAGARVRSRARLLQSLESPRLRILRQFNLVPEGVHALVGMRADLLQLAPEGGFAGLDQDFLRVFSAWFDIGFLELRRIGWGSPAALLEKLIRYEAVHEIKSWSDLRNRLDSDRRCYAFFHPRMPDEPLIFVEVALVRSLADNVQALLDEQAPTLDPATATTAIFYSISNAQGGLRGVSMGECLIKRVVQLLVQEFPRLRQFATLSPLPGFGAWLDARLAGGVGPRKWPAALTEQLTGGARSPADGLRRLLRQTIDGNGPEDPALKAWLTRECALYLLREKKRGEPLDPVARFHFSNGASLGRINWLADPSPHGVQQSCGLMVNYLYTLREIDANHRAFAETGQLAAAPDIRKLIDGAARPARPA